MKPPLFHLGQAVVCIKAGKMRPGCPFSPKEGAVYEVEQCLPDNTPGDAKGWWITCVEWSGQLWAHESLFAPVEEMPAEMLAELLEAFKLVTA